jgi:hypothetical protein
MATMADREALTRGSDPEGNPYDRLGEAIVGSDRHLLRLIRDLRVSLNWLWCIVGLNTAALVVMAVHGA